MAKFKCPSCGYNMQTAHYCFTCDCIGEHPLNPEWARKMTVRFDKLNTDARITKNGYGKLDYKDMKVLLLKGNPNLTDSEMRAVFDSADSRGNGVIEFKELLWFLYGSPVHCANEGVDQSARLFRPDARRLELAAYCEETALPMTNGWELRSFSGHSDFGDVRRPRHNGTDGIAHYLHFDHPTLKHPSYWGVSLGDIREFNTMVRHAVDTGKLTNPTGSRFPYSQYNFDVFGPNMYMANEQLIMPVTGSSRNALPFTSWSLMKNAERGGLKCDLFVSHAWAEGAYEFAWNIEENWPDGCTAAYVCFLSNPQWLDVSALVEKPETSPFHQVLQSGVRQVIWLTNANERIHGRLWCVYEAYCATDFNIPIHIAGQAIFLLQNHEEWCKRFIVDMVADSPYTSEDTTRIFSEVCHKDRDFREQMMRRFAPEGLREGRLIQRHHVGIKDGKPILLERTVDDGLTGELFSEQEMLLDYDIMNLFQKYERHFDVTKALCSSTSDREAIWAALKGKERQLTKMVKIAIRKAVGFGTDMPL